jgi:hypothetical protein
MSKSKGIRSPVGEISLQAYRLASIGCPHNSEDPCKPCQTDAQLLLNSLNSRRKQYESPNGK